MVCRPPIPTTLPRHMRATRSQNCRTTQDRGRQTMNAIPNPRRKSSSKSLIGSPAKRSSFVQPAPVPFERAGAVRRRAHAQFDIASRSVTGLNGARRASPRRTLRHPAGGHPVSRPHRTASGGTGDRPVRAMCDRHAPGGMVVTRAGRRPGLANVLRRRHTSRCDVNAKAAVRRRCGSQLP